MNTTSPKIKFEYAIVCDDVRREENGKMIIIGVYANDIVVASYPSNLKLSIVLAVHSDAAVQTPIRTRFLLDSNVVMEGGATISLSVAGTGLFTMIGIPVNVTKDTILDVQARADKGRFKSVLKIPIRKKSP